MDFFCHGVPSMHLWQKYLQEVEKLTGNVTYVSWRNKLTAWHDSYDLLIRGEKVSIIQGCLKETGSTASF